MVHTKSPLLSICTITYNDFEGFLRTYQSVISSISDNVEWIIKDGGSDYSVVKQICQLDLGSNSKFITKYDLGVYDAMNYCLKLSRGNWLLFMNSGDEFVSDTAFQRLINQLISLSDLSSDKVILGGSTYLIDSCKRRFFRPSRSLTDCLGVNSCRMPCYHQSTIYSRQLYTSLDFHLFLPVSADHAFFWESIKSGAKYIPLDFAISNFYLGGLSTQRKLRSCLDVGFSILYLQQGNIVLRIFAIFKRFALSYLSWFRF